MSTPTTQTRFLTSQNPAQVKRNVLASFTDVLLLPVTIVPRTTVAVGKAFSQALTTGGTAAVQGIAMLNPQRWGATNTQQVRDGYAEFAEGAAGTTLFDVGGDEDEDEEDDKDMRTKKHQSSCAWAWGPTRFCPLNARTQCPFHRHSLLQAR